MAADLTTRFVPYLAALRVSATGSLDTTTLLAKDIPVKRAADVDPDDLNSTLSRVLPPVPGLLVHEGPAWFEAPDAYFAPPPVPAKKAAVKRAATPRRKV